jgi:hypothetical protein
LLKSDFLIEMENIAMSYVSDARAKLEAELKHCQKGAEFYRQRCDSLAKAIAQLNAIGEVEGIVEMKPGRGSTGKKAKTKIKADARARDRLPNTGGDFFLRMLTNEPQSPSRIFEAIRANLEFTPTKDEVATLRNRLMASLAALVKAGKIRDNGVQGQGRQYFVE